MASKKKKSKTLPKDFDEQLKSADLATLMQVFETCEIDAQDRYHKNTALLMTSCPDELARCLVAQGANVRAVDRYGKTALHSAARSRRNIALLIELGCDVHARDSDGETPLHSAADAKNLTAIECLIAAGADVNATTKRDSLTPLEVGLRGCYNIHITTMVPVAKTLLKAGARKTPATKKFVQEIGEKFEFYRTAFAKDSVEETSKALVALCKLFDVEPPPRRVMHDGKAPIKMAAGTWQRQFDELWNLLVPSKGPAATVQGEVIRIIGRLSDEIARNGGGNWDKSYTQMARAYINFVRGGHPLDESEATDAKKIIDEIIKRKGGGGDHDYDRLGELSVKWVGQNPTPVPLGKVPYDH